ncbi:MAG: nicotinate-nucleotide--dimethylbenzimidazole phosphoribosyltransferase [Oscillospiraceae bacterium]|jgi:nicotinate-nucleotide--dimethylbenzimidazole phosphoribosyltransferase|nr:nicotinate-nucleotide--dimethylbenzimidazole phosphoribosyltransferase [Oscillospiraceae bacterium]
MDEARKRWDSLAKPLGSLGLLEDVVVRIAALTGNADVHLNNRALLVLCADNGVVAQGVTQTDSLVTAAVARTLGAGESTVCHMARTADCRVVPVDIGVLDFPGTAGVLDRRVRNGTGDITQGPAMSRDECLRAIEVGMELVREQKAAGADILATGEMGIGNTTTSSAVASVLLGLPPAQVTGRGAGLSDAGLARKIAAIERAVSINRPDPADPVDVLSKLGGLDLAGLCGVFLGGVEYRIPVLVDGFISAVAALCAVRQKPEAGSAMLASHVSAEPAGRLVLDALGLKPLITAEMRLGEGSGAVAALPLLDMALAVYHSGHTFGKMGMEPYIPQN